MKQAERSLKDFRESLYKVEIKKEHVDYKIAESYLPFFHFLDSLKSSAIIVFDYYKYNYFYASENVHKIFGFNWETIFSTNLDEVRKRFHPEDFIINVAAVKARSFILDQSVERRKDYKFTQELRILNDKNEWVRMIVQSTNIELDAIGNFWLNMCLCDFSPIQDLNTPGRAVLWDTKTGKVIFSMEGQKQNDIPLTNREEEVLKLISVGMRSKEIADQLFISINTVHNHRKKLLEKMNVSNSSEAINCAARLGII